MSKAGEKKSNPVKKRKPEKESAAAEPDGDGTKAAAGRKGPGRPPGVAGESVIDQVLEIDKRSCEKAWATYSTRVNYVSLPPPYHDARFRCWDFTGTIATTGYGELSLLGHGKSKVKMHILSHFLHTGQQPISNPKQEISHLCHRKSCFNPHHLFREATAVNSSRDYCLSTTALGGQYIDMCPHNPKCLRPGSQVRNCIVTAVPAATLTAVLDATMAANDASRAVIAAKDATLKEALAAQDKATKAKFVSFLSSK